MVVSGTRRVRVRVYPGVDATDLTRVLIFCGFLLRVFVVPRRVLFVYLQDRPAGVYVGVVDSQWTFRFARPRRLNVRANVISFGPGAIIHCAVPFPTWGATLQVRCFERVSYSVRFSAQGRGRFCFQAKCPRHDATQRRRLYLVARHTVLHCLRILANRVRRRPEQIVMTWHRSVLQFVPRCLPLCSDLSRVRFQSKR